MADDQTSDDQTFHDDIEGYCGELSYPVGAAVGLHVSTRSATFDVRVERWGASREHVWAATDVAGIFTPPPSDADAEGCRWPVTLQIPIAEHWRSGFHLVTLTATDAPPGRDVAHAGFVVRGRAAAGGPRALLVLATNTYNAYNTWGGRSLYTGGKQVSFGRPFGRGMLMRPRPNAMIARPARVRGEEPDVDGVIYQQYRIRPRLSRLHGLGRLVHLRTPIRRVGRGAGLRVRLRRVVRSRTRPDASSTVTTSCSASATTSTGRQASVTRSRRTSAAAATTPACRATRCSGRSASRTPGGRWSATSTRAHETDPVVGRVRRETDDRHVGDPVVGRPERSFLGAGSAYGLYSRFGGRRPGFGGVHRVPRRPLAVRRHRPALRRPARRRRTAWSATRPSVAG